MTPAFVHLHLHSEYSLADGLIRLKPLVQRAAEADMPAIAVTDLCNFFGMVKFYRYALAAGVKPIVGMEVEVQPSAAEEGASRLVLLAQNRDGYRSLARLSSRAYRDGWLRGRACVERDWIVDCADGVIALSGGAQGDIGLSLLAGREDIACEQLDYWRRAFDERFYLEVTRTGRAQEDRYLSCTVEIAAASDVPIVATNDVRFLDRSDFDAHEARVCIQEGYVLADPKRPRRYSDQQYLRTAEEMASLFSDLPEAIENTVEIAKRCNFELSLGSYHLPAFKIPTGTTLEDYLADRSRRGLEERLSHGPDREAANGGASRGPYHERLDAELRVIQSMGFAGYFLIVADFIHWARENRIPVGPGRGSGAGSLVAYALGITDLDPLVYDLLFERFLNPERVSMPDFDVDFCMEGRDRVIEYVALKYGRDHVSQIATHGSMAARAVVRDVGRVMSHPYGFVDRIAKLIPFELGVTLEKALRDSEELKGLYDGDEEVRAIIDMGRALEGLARSVGRHAGGVVIAPEALTEFTPLYNEEGSDAVVSQLDKDDVEAIGLVKFDFLGLRTLTIIDWAVQTINARNHGGERDLDVGALPLDDPATYALLKAQKTTAVFQLESSGIKDLIRRLQPDCFEDIVALVALFRPGPLQSGMVDDFIDRKHGRAAVVYPHADLEPILRPTYGVILYQEQVMQIAQVLAGYSLGGADLLRRAMGKKKVEEMAEQRAVFTAGALRRGVEEATATGIFDLMEKFAGYGFNRSHSAAYALISYQTAWLKAHHTAAFMAAVLSSDMDNTDKIVIFIDECRQLELDVQPPSVNESEYRFTVGARDQIVYGLGAVKGVGASAIEAVVDERNAAGPFVDLFDLCRRVDMQKVNRRAMESLIRAGALDCFGGGRASAMVQLPEALKLADQHSRNCATGQDDLFGLIPAKASTSLPAPHLTTDIPEWEEAQRLKEEKQTLGFYLTGHPIEGHLPELEQYASGRIPEVLSAAERDLRGGGRRRREKPVVVAGLVVDRRERVSIRGSRMAFVTLDDRLGRVEARLFGDVYQQYGHLIAEDEILIVEGQLVYEEFSDSIRLNAKRLLDLDGAREAYGRRIELTLDSCDFGNGFAVELEEVLKRFGDGFCPVVVDYRGDSAVARLALDTRWKVRPVRALTEQLGGMVGRDRVRLRFQ